MALRFPMPLSQKTKFVSYYNPSLTFRSAVAVSHCFPKTVLKLGPSKPFSRKLISVTNGFSAITVSAEVAAEGAESITAEAAEFTTAVAAPSIPVPPPSKGDRPFTVCAVFLVSVFVFQFVKTQEFWKIFVKKNEKFVEFLKSVESDLKFVISIVGIGALVVKFLKFDQKMASFGWPNGIPEFWDSLFTKYSTKSQAEEMLVILKFLFDEAKKNKKDSGDDKAKK